MKTLVSCCLLFFMGEKAISAEKTLDFNRVTHYQIVIEPGVYGLFAEDKTVMTFGGEGTFYVRSNYKPDAKDKDLGFGSLHNPYDETERLSYEPKDKPRRIRNALRLGQRTAFLDVMNRQFVVYHNERKVWLSPSEVMLDIVKPPRDAKGEPTRAEIAALRGRFSKELSRERENPDLLAGIAKIPKAWKDRDGSQYVLWLRGTSYPLVTLKCDKEEFRSCLVQRACFLKHKHKEDYAKITSITYDEKRDSLLLLHAEKSQILRLNGSSCLSQELEVDYRLPKSLSNAQSLFVDDSRRLWIGLKEAEAETSGSLFVWNADSW